MKTWRAVKTIEEKIGLELKDDTKLWLAQSKNNECVDYKICIDLQLDV